MTQSTSLMLELFENLKKQIPGCSITLSDSTKRSDGEWHARWTFVVRDCNGRPLFESVPWFGYETLNEAILALSECLECYMKTSTKADKGNLLRAAPWKQSTTEAQEEEQ